MKSYVSKQSETISQNTQLEDENCEDFSQLGTEMSYHCHYLSLRTSEQDKTSGNKGVHKSLTITVTCVSSLKYNKASLDFLTRTI